MQFLTVPIFSLSQRILRPLPLCDNAYSIVQSIYNCVMTYLYFIRLIVSQILSEYAVATADKDKILCPLAAGWDLCLLAYLSGIVQKISSWNKTESDFIALKDALPEVYKL